jgi:DME family drug/metabolite transporter
VAASAAAVSASGAALAVGSAATFALYVLLLNDPDIRRVEGPALIFWLGTAAGSVFLLILLAANTFGGRGAAAAVAGRPPVALFAGAAAALGMATVPTLLAASLFARGNRIVGGATASVLSTLEPVTALLVGRLALGEPARPAALAGSALVLAGAALISWESARRQQKPPPVAAEGPGGGAGGSDTDDAGR